MTASEWRFIIFLFLYPYINFLGLMFMILLNKIMVKSIPPSAELIAPALLVRLTEEFFF